MQLGLAQFFRKPDSPNTKKKKAVEQKEKFTASIQQQRADRQKAAEELAASKRPIGRPRKDEAQLRASSSNSSKGGGLRTKDLKRKWSRKSRSVKSSRRRKPKTKAWQAWAT